MYVISRETETGKQFVSIDNAERWTSDPCQAMQYEKYREAQYKAKFLNICGEDWAIEEVPNNGNGGAPLTTEGYAAVRRYAVDNRAWLDITTLADDEQTAHELARDADKADPGWYGENPVLRIAKVAISEKY
jgi:hypothetical protein